MKFNSVQNNFASGELSRLLKGAMTFEEYSRGVAEMTNFLPMKQGGASFRSGTSISSMSADLDLDVSGGANYPKALFNFSPRDGENYLVTLDPGSNGSLTKAIVVTRQFSSVTVSMSAYPWNMGTDFTDSATAYSYSSASIHRELIDSLQVVTQGDVMLVFDGRGELAPIVLMRISEDFIIVDSMLRPNKFNLLPALYLNTPFYQYMRVPYADPNIDTNIRLKPSATTGNITITAENASAVAVAYFDGVRTGQHIKITHSGVTGVALVTSKVSDSQLNATVVIDFGAATASSNFEEGAWCPVYGYPKAASFFEGRLVVGGNKKFPDTIWNSLAGNIYHFTQRRLEQDSASDTSGSYFFGDAKATDPFSFIPSSQEANFIQWIHASDSLLVGTTKTEFSITGTQETPYSLGAFFIKDISHHGSSNVQPVKVGSSVFFVSNDGKRLMEIPKRLAEYSSATELNLTADGLIAKAVNLSTEDELADIQSRIVKLVWQESEGVLWVLCKNVEALSSGWQYPSALISLTYNQTAKVVGWAKHVFAGDPAIYSIAAVPSLSKGNFQDVYLFLQRGSEDYSLEYIGLRNTYDKLLCGDSEGALWAGRMSVYMDGVAEGTGAANGEITLDAAQASVWPAGTTFSVFATPDNVSTYSEYLGDFAENAGVVTVPDEDFTGRLVTLGVKYEGEIKTMPIEAGAQFGFAQGSPRRTHELSVYVDRSLGGVYKASKSANEFELVPSSEASEQELYTGEIRLQHDGDYDDHQVVIKQTGPFPMTVLWLLTKGYTYDS